VDDYIVTMEHICKEFPGVKALDDVSFNLKKGEVMALLGENGAGKSTLMKVLSGIYQRDQGTINLFGEEIGNLTPKVAKEKGIAIIHQELNMCPHLSVSENIFLGREKEKKHVLDNAQMNKMSSDLLQRLGVGYIKPTTLVGELPLAKQQMVEIAKALSLQAKVLIMDEPTSSLSSKEINDLFVIIKQLKAEGCGIVYISHRLEELKHIVDRVTIMRDGHFITRGNFTDFTMEQIITQMVGREIKEKYPRVTCTKGKMILDVQHLNAGPLVRDISFQIHAGEIVGLAGLLGAGRTETTRALFGVDPKESGEISLDGKRVKIDKPRDAIKLGIVLAPENRKKDGLCTKLPVKDNIALPNLDLLSSRLGIVNKKKEKEMVQKAISDLDIKLPSSEVDAANLSGGNQQKVVVGKWLARNSRVVLFDEPTRGIDVAAKVEIYHLMNRLKQQGIGVLFVSSEMPEIMGVSDRIIVMCDGRITGELSREEATQEKILTLETRFENKLDQKREG
jgi:ribose transport system ATP-binding protein